MKWWVSTESSEQTRLCFVPHEHRARLVFVFTFVYFVRTICVQKDEYIFSAFQISLKRTPIG